MVTCVQTRASVKPGRLPATPVVLATAGVMLWILVAAALFAWSRDLANVLAGPFSIDRDALVSLRNPDELWAYHIELTADSEQRLFASAHTLGQEPYSYYVLLHLGDKLLLAQVPGDHTGSSYAGVLEPFTPYECEYLVERYLEKNPGKELLPYRLDATRPLWLWAFYFRIVPLAALLAGAAWCTLRLVRQRFIMRYFQCDG